MELSFNNKKGKDYASIFSKIKDKESQKKEHYSEFQDNLSKLEHSVSLLIYYETKTKVNPKKIKKKYFSIPKVFQTEPNHRAKVSKRIIKSIDLELNLTKTNNNEGNNLNTISHNNPMKVSSLTHFNNNKTKKKLFMTHPNYKNKKGNSKIITSTTNDITNKSKNETLQTLPPVQDKNNINSNGDENSNNNNNPTYSTLENTFLKTKVKKNDKKNKIFISSMKINPKVKSLNKKPSIETEKFPKVANYMIRSVKKENNNIRKAIHTGMDRFNIMDWYMQTRFKYAQYKFGIAEIQKYFMDLKAYGKPEEEEIEKRKTFYEHVEDIIQEIHEIKEMKEFEKLNKKYGIEQDKKKLAKSNKEQKENDDQQQKQMVELSRALQQIAKRQKKEKQRRDQIDAILFKCKQSIHSIYNFDKKFPSNKNNI